MNDQLKEFLSSKNALSEFQSGFRKKHRTSTPIIKVLYGLMVSLDNKNHSAALFIDLSKTFDLVDHEILKQRLLSVGLSVNTVGWFGNYLSDRSLQQQQQQIKLGWALFVTYTIIQSIMRSEMCSLHLTHPSVHTWSSGQPTVQRPGSSRGLPVGAGIRTHNLGLPRVSSPTLYPLGQRLPCGPMTAQISMYKYRRTHF